MSITAATRCELRGGGPASVEVGTAAVVVVAARLVVVVCAVVVVGATVLVGVAAAGSFGPDVAEAVPMPTPRVVSTRTVRSSEFDRRVLARTPQRVGERSSAVAAAHATPTRTSSRGADPSGNGLRAAGARATTSSNSTETTNRPTSSPAAPAMNPIIGGPTRKPP